MEQEKEIEGFGYHIDGKNISKIVKEQKLKYGWILFYKIKDKYKLENWDVKNSIIYFEINGVEYKLGLPSQKITRRRLNDWSKKPMTYIKEHSGEDPNPKKEQIYKYTSKDSIIDFGKYKGLSFQEVFDENPNYIVYLFNNTKSKYIRSITESFLFTS